MNCVVNRLVGSSHLLTDLTIGKTVQIKRENTLLKRRKFFVQYLKAGKVPGAKTVEDVKNFYLSKSPIRRGCTPVDVAKAVFYCVEQTYETGQAIPVTGGQTMLN